MRKKILFPLFSILMILMNSCVPLTVKSYQYNTKIDNKIELFFTNLPQKKYSEVLLLEVIGFTTTEKAIKMMIDISKEKKIDAIIDIKISFNAQNVRYYSGIGIKYE